MTREQLKMQAIFRVAAFFIITTIIGFVIGDINMLGGQ